MQSFDHSPVDKIFSSVSSPKSTPPNLQKADGTFLEPDSLFELCAQEINKHMRCRKHNRCHKKFVLLTPLLPKQMIYYLLRRFFIHKLMRFFKKDKLPPAIYRNERVLEEWASRPLHSVTLSEFKTNKNLQLLPVSVSGPS